MTTKLGRVGISLLLLAAAACSGSDGTNGSDGTAGQPGAQGSPGTTGPAGTNGTSAATFSLIEPRVGLLGREYDVVVSAQSATFDSGATIDFGDSKITVSGIKVISPTTLYAHVKVDNGAKLGAKDVKIGKIVGTAAFDVKPAVEVKVSGPSKQGSIVQVELTNNDLDNPFDTATFALVTPPGLVALGGQAANGKKATFGMLIEPTAAPGAMQIAGANGADTLFLSDPKAVAVAANAPAAITGTKDETFVDAFDTKLYKFSTTEDTIVSLHAVTTDPSLVVPQAILLPTSGKVEDLLTVMSAPIDPSSWFNDPLPPPYDITWSYPSPKGTADAFVMLSDLATKQDANSKLAFTVTTIPATGFAEAATAHVDAATAQPATACVVSSELKPCLITGEIKAAAEVDTYKIEGLTAAATLEVSVQSAAGISVVAIDATKNSVKSADSNLASAITVSGSKGSAHAGYATTKAGFKSWVIAVNGSATANAPLGKYSIGVRVKP